MTQLTLTEELRDLIARKDFPAMREFFASGHPAANAEVLAGFELPDIIEALGALNPEIRAATFSHLDPEPQVEIIGASRRRDRIALVTAMSPDDRVDLLRRLPEERREDILPGLAQAERDDILRLSSYPEGTAGSVMTSEYVALAPEMTAAQALEKIRQDAPDAETIYYAYVVDGGRRLLGLVSLRDLILARPGEKLRDIMQTEVISAKVEDDREEAVQKISRYDLLALPVTGGGDALVGIITHDDAMDVLSQEHTEDMEKFMAISGSHEPGAYLRTSSWTHFKNRAVWIIGLAALELVSGAIIHRFEDAFSRLLILALYMPMVADTGGNTGSQSATVVIRALALGELSPRDAFRVLFKEFKISLLLALTLGVLSFAKILFLSHGEPLPPGFSIMDVGLAISIALAAQVVTATMVGAVLPMAVSAFDLDPAVIASPALTTVVDVTGLILYFTTAKLMLGV